MNRVIADDARAALEALVRDRVEAGRRAARLGRRGRTRTSSTRQLRGDLLRALGILGNDPERAGARAGALRALPRGRVGGRRQRAARPHRDPGRARATRPSTRSSSSASGRARTPQEEQRYLYALAGFRQPELVGQTLEKTINGEIRSQDAPFVVRALLVSVYGRGLAWDFVKATLGDDGRGSIRRARTAGCSRASPRSCSAGVGAGGARLLRRRTGSMLGGKTLEQYLEQLRVAVRLQEREAARLAAYLAKPAPPAPQVSAPSPNGRLRLA